MINQDVSVRCNCGCVVINVMKDSDYDGQRSFVYYLSAYESSFYSRQSKIKQYFKRLWSAIIGKDYFLYEVVLDEDEYRKLWI